MFMGVTNELTIKPPNVPIIQFKNITEITVLGVGIGLTYPISFPIIGAIIIMNI